MFIFSMMSSSIIRNGIFVGMNDKAILAAGTCSWEWRTSLK